MWWEYRNSTTLLKERTFEQLKTVRESKKIEIESYFAQIRQEIGYFAQNSLVNKAMRDFKEAFEKIQPNELPLSYSQQLRIYYENEFIPKLKHHQDTFNVEDFLPTNYKSILLQTQYLVSNKTSFKPSSYSYVHDKYHSSLSTFLKIGGYYDMFLVEDETGYIIYSVNKEADFGTSLLSGAYADSNLGRLYRKIRHTGIKYHTMLCDFETYLPSYLAPAAFIAAPIFDEEKKIGTLIFQVPIDKIDGITTNEKTWKERGLNETGECYIVGNDFKMRTNSRFILESPQTFLEQMKKIGADSASLALMKFHETTILFQTVENEIVRKAFANQTGVALTKDYREQKVLISYSPLAIQDVEWVIITEIDAKEALKSVEDFAWRSISILGIACLLIVITSFFIAHRISKPILKLLIGTIQLSRGDLHVQVDVKSKDEIGILADSFNQTVISLREQRKEILEKQEEIARQMEEISQQAEKLQEINNEISSKNEEITKKNLILEQQKEQIMVQAENLRQLNEEITQINNFLEEKVKERTAALEAKNKKLLEYAFINSHRLRAPVATILGLMNVIKVTSNVEEKQACIDMLEKTTQKLDEIVHEIQDTIYQAEQQT
jgi:methyl-accepting chemotaxis protein